MTWLPGQKEASDEAEAVLPLKSEGSRLSQVKLLPCVCPQCATEAWKGM